MATGKRVGYIRVSTLDQNTERQLEAIKLDKTFTDKASGKDVHRPRLKAALDFLREGDTLVVHSMDRLARNVEDMLRMVRELTSEGIAVEFIKERLTFRGKDAPMDTLMLTMLSAFAAFERSLIRERQREGIAIAKAKGVYKGRKRSLTSEQVKQVRAQVAAGTQKATIARDFGISRETLYQYLRQSTVSDKRSGRHSQ
jgi:DNA invertase Pin-like site-specific DNA recombinase